jgi:GPH family glycoside/pentoside/hexuronide:cation symporter
VVIGYSAGSLGTGLLPVILASWMMYFYSPPEGEGIILISALMLGQIRMYERIIGAVVEPMIGYLSDRTKSRFGRRIPWIALGLPFLVGSFVLIWFPPAGRGVDDLSVLLHCGVTLMIFFASYTVVVAPFVAMLPELTADSAERVRLSMWMSYFEVLSNVAGALGAGLLVGAGAVTVLGFAFDNGYQLLGVVVGFIAFLSFLPVTIFVREPPRSASHEVPFSLWRAMVESLKNPQFVPYSLAVSGFRFGTTSVVVAMPFVATQLMGQSEEVAGYMLAIIIIVAALAFPLVLKLAEKHGKARVFRWGALGYLVVLPLTGTIGLFPVSPLVHGAVLFVAAGFSTATVLVLPRALLADVIDVDEQRTGYRREAMYNGMSGVLEKVAEALATGFVGVLFQFYGNSAANPLGIRLIGLGAAAGLGIGLWCFRRYTIA